MKSTSVIFPQFLASNPLSGSKKLLGPKKLLAMCIVGAALLGCDAKQPASEENVQQTNSSEQTVSEPKSVSESAADAADISQLHQSLLTIDTHIDIPITLGLDDADPRELSPMQVDLPKARSGGLDAGFLIVYVAQGPVSEQGYATAYEEAQQKFTAIERMVANSPNDVALVRNPEELKAAVADGKFAVAVGVENAFSLGSNYEHLKEFYDRGARYISLTHFGHNDFGDSSGPKGEQEGVAEPVNHGLSEKGRALIAAMNRWRIMVDVSHTSKESTLAAAEFSRTPVIASHSGVKALFDHPRNLSDEEIKTIAKYDGVIQLVAFDSYLRALPDEAKAEIEAIKAKMGFEGADWYKKVTQTQMGEFRNAVAALNAQWPRATIKTFVDHIEYVIKLVGIDHAGIASDFGGGGGIEGWDDISQSAAITEELVNRGYSKEDIEKIWSGNLLRVWSKVEAYGKAQQ
ncbi:dipeptidase [Sessilibacter sp. MAH4]